MDLNPEIDYNNDVAKGFLSGITKGITRFPNEIITDVQNGSYYDY
jgi:hypothetical protein